MKEKLFKKGIKKRLFSVVLALAMVVTLMPMGGIVAYAATTPICRCDEHDQHINIYKIENGNVYYYWYEQNIYQGMSNRTVANFTTNYGTSPVNGNWYYSNYKSQKTAGECGVANAIPDCGCDGHDQHVYIYKIENGNVYYYWYEQNIYQGMSNRTVANFTTNYGTSPEHGNWYYSNYKSSKSAGECNDASHFHTYDMTVWSSDASNHWHPATCSHSTQKKDASAHGNWNATTGKCGTCGYECLHTGQTGATCAVCGKTLHTHTWEYSSDGTNTIKAHCKTAGHSGDDITLTLTATSPNYSGSPIAKATLFGGMDFTAFNNATGLNLSAADIKIYAATDTSKATALDTIKAAGSYVAVLTVDSNDATLDFTVGRAPNAYTFVYANTVGWSFYPQLAEILKTNGVGGDTITIKNSLEAGPAIAVKTSGGPDSDDSWNGSSISCTPGSSTNLTIPANYVVDMIQLNGLEFVCKLKSVHTHNFTYSASGSTLTATCSADGCGLTDKKVSLTLTASDTNYSGIAGSSTPVTFTKVDGSGTLSSTNLGTATKWTYNETAYEVYNGFIPSTSGSGWNDAMGFVAALNTAKFDGHEDWTLLSSEAMAKAWNTSHSSVDRGGVNYLWSSVEDESGDQLSSYRAHYLSCRDGDWGVDFRANSYSKNGFVVLRPASGSTVTPTNKIVTLGDETTRKAWTDAGLELPTVNYAKTGGESLGTTEPTTKGHYTASISAGSPVVTASVNFDIVDKHAHLFTYSADGAVLTATCNHSGDLIENCDLTDKKVSLTLTASSANYSGSAVEASYDNTSKTAWTAAGLALPTITYEAKEGSELTDSNAVKVGSYTAKASITVTPAEGNPITYTATADFTIDKAAAVVATAPTGNTNLTYTGSAQALATAGTAGTGASKVQYSLEQNGTYSDSVPTATDVGDYTVWYKAIADTSGNYKDSEAASVTAKINGANFGENDVTAAPYSNTYDGAAHGISVTLTGAAEGGTITYSTASNGEYSATPITKTDVVSNYTVYYKVTKTGYNAGTGSSTITITAKALTADDITVTAPSSNGSDLGNSVVVKFGNTTLVKGTDYDVTYAPETVKDAGEYKATLTFKGNYYSETSVEKTFTVSKPSSGGGSSSPTVTVPVSGDQHSVNVSASVSGTTATVNIKDADIEKITHADAETGVVEIDLSGLKHDVNTAKIPTATMDKIADAIADSKNDTEGVSIKLSSATVTFDGKATTAIADQAKGNTIEIKVDEADKKTLTAEQKSSIEGLGSQIVIEATVISNGQKISDFKGGSAEVSVPYTLKNAQKANGLVVFFVADDGSVEKVPATYVDGNVVFTVKHFSHYVVAYNAANVFTDVAEGDYYYDAVKWAVENGITKGTSATTFSPNGITTRAQVVAFLWRAAGCPEPKGNASKFTDIVAGEYYETAVAWAVENGITNGATATTFSPDAECTRAQVVTFLYRFNGVNTLNIKDNPFSDVPAGKFYYDAVLWAAENGITSGTTATTFSPVGSCTRGQSVTFLYRLLNK